MLQKKVIYSVELQEYRPIIWYGQPVFERYQQLNSILASGLGENYASFLAEPVISKQIIDSRGKAHWMSDKVTQPKPFSQFTINEQEVIRQKLQLLINNIKQYANTLIDSQHTDQKELGELLLLATEVPSLDNVLVENDQIILVLWGFSSEKSKLENFQLSKSIEKPLGSTVIIPPVIETSSETPPEKLVIEKQLDQLQNNKMQPQNLQNISNNQTPPPPVNTTSQQPKKSMPGWLWFVIGALIMFLILFLIWFFLLRDKENPILPDEHGVLPPIDSTKTGVDPDDPAKRKIFIDRVNVALVKDADMEAFGRKINEKFADEIEIVYYDTTIRLLQIQTPENEWKQWIDSLKKMPEVKLAFNESMFERGAKPTDPAFSQNDKNWYFDAIQAYQAWDITKGSPDVVIAILDNGFDLSHPEFAGKIVNAWNVVTRSDKLFPAGQQGNEHGTHVAATATGLADNNLGLCGIAPNCKLMPIQLGDESGQMTSLSVVAGVLYAIHHNADVVNMSLGMMFPPEVTSIPEEQQRQLTKELYPDEEKFWDELFQFGEEAKMVMVLAAGNQNILAGIDPFARSKRTLIVAAYSPAQNKADFSNYGEFSNISAPGVNIYSAVPGNAFNFLDGTSMASPIVTGGVALIKSKHPDWTAEQITDALIKTAKPMTEHKIGPLIQLFSALNYVPGDSVMIIPENPKDLKFAEGKWKSTSDLINTVDNKKVELFFDIEANGKGKLTLIEANGNKCTADLDIKFEDGKLLLIQKDKANCAENNKFYYPYRFECVQGENNIANCKAKQLDGSGDLIDFNMKKL